MLVEATSGRGLMHRGLLIPTERPPTDIDIKRALLTLDEVQLLNPADRELIPPDQFAFASANLVGAPSLSMFSSNGPVLPLGKIPRYDETFERTLEECADAEKKGFVVVRSVPAFNTGFLLGAPPAPQDWPNSTFTLGMLKMLGGDPQVLMKTLEGVAAPDMLRRMDLADLVPAGTETTMEMRVGAQDFKVPMNTAVAALELSDVPGEFIQAYTRLAAARLGSVVKSLGICHNAGLHPVSVDRGVNAVIAHIQGKSTSVLQSSLTAESDPEALRLAMRVERVLFEQMLPDEILGSLTVEKVIQLRSKAWGAAGEHRQRLLKTVRDIAQDVNSPAEFDARVLKEVTAYQRANQAFDDELKLKGLRAGGWVVTGGAASAAKHVVEQALGLGSWELALLLGAGITIKQLAPDAMTLWRKLAELRASTGKVLLHTYNTVGIK